MTIKGIATNFISQLGNNANSIVPLATKDLIKNQASVYTYYKNGGKHDAAERMVEENGTSIIWLAGIPVIKKILDKTLYKKAGISPDVDIRKLKDGAADSLAYSLDKLKNSTRPLSEAAKGQIDILEKVASKPKLTKGLFVGKFAAATALTMAALGGLIIFKQKKTEDNIKKEIKAKYEARLALHNSVKDNDVFDIFNGNKTGEKIVNSAAINASGEKINTRTQKPDGINFTGSIGHTLSNFMYNPIWNQSILDAGILTTRTAQGREGEKDEILFKEFFEIMFLYVLSKPIQDGLEKLSEIAGKPIGLSFNTLNSNILKESLKDNSLKDSIEKLGDYAKKPGKELLDFIYEDVKNPIVKLLKESGDVKTIKQTVGKKFGLFNIKKATDEIDALAFIDTNQVKKTISKLYKMATVNAADRVKDIDKSLKVSKVIKVAAIFLNIAIGVFATGILQPILTINKRKMQTGGNENPAIIKLEAEMQNQFSFKGAKPKKA